MKKALLLFVILLLIGSTAFTQVQMGVGIMAGTKSKVDFKQDRSVNGGFHARALLDLSDQIFVTSGFSYYLPYKYNYHRKNNTFNNMGFNADLNYNLIDNGEIILYGLGGINLDLKSSKYVENGEVIKNPHESKYDFEFGAGIRIECCFAEIKFDHNKDQIQIFIGLYL
jgi:hypothetical protein